MGWFALFLWIIFFMFIIFMGAWMYEAIDYYTEPEETILEKKVKNIKERYKWLRLNMGE